MLSHIVMTVMCTLLLCTCTHSGSPPLSCISPMYWTRQALTHQKLGWGVQKI